MPSSQVLALDNRGPQNRQPKQVWKVKPTKTQPQAEDDDGQKGMVVNVSTEENKWLSQSWADTLKDLTMFDKVMNINVIEG